MPKQRTIPDKSQKVTRIFLYKSIFNRNQRKLQSDRFLKGDWHKLPNRNQTLASYLAVLRLLNNTVAGTPNHTIRLCKWDCFNAIPSTNRLVQLSAGCVAFGGVESSHRGPEQPLRPGRRRSTDFINTRLHISDNGVKMRRYLDRFLQHRHSASRLRLPVLVVSFYSFLSPLSSL